MLLFIVFTIMWFTPSSVEAYEPFVTLPGFNYSGGSVAEVVNGVFLLLLAIGAVWGVVKIAFAGVKYTMTDIIPQKTDALGEIKGVLLGLAILVIPYLILYTINPDLTNMRVFDRIGGLDSGYTPSAPPEQGPGGTISGGWSPIKEGYTRGPSCGLIQTDASLNRTPEQCAVDLNCDVSDLVYSNSRREVACETIPEIQLLKINPLYTQEDLDAAISMCSANNGVITNLSQFSEGFEFTPRCEVPNPSYEGP